MDTETSTENSNRPLNKHRRHKRIAAAIVLLFIIALAACLWMFLQPKPISESLGGDFYDQGAAEIQTAIDHSVEDGYFNMTINSRIPVYENKTALAGIQNIESNKFDCSVAITLDDGTPVYTSGGISPGQELQQITLDKPLENGTYTATALFTIYDQNDTHSKAGETASKVTLFVQ